MISHENKYAAFIMTYKRVDILPDTILQLMSQTLPPSKILIVDNDPEESAAVVAGNFKDRNVSYFPVGYNSGPAGAAFYGLKILFEEQWEWVLWMDDNDPPQFPDVIEKLFTIPGRYRQTEKIGMLGAVGVKFDTKRAKTLRLPDESLCGILEVDNVGGGYSPMINRRVYQKGIMPDKNLFFGFEELDFSLAIKRAGFVVLISGEEIYRHRQKAGRLNFKRKLYAVKSIKSLWREFYSVRNVVYILKFKEKATIGLCSLLLKVVGKSLIGYRWGWKYGVTNMKYLLGGYYNGWIGRMGKKSFE